MTALLKRYGWLPLGIILGTVAAILPKCEGPGPHPFTVVSHVTHQSPEFNIRYTQVPRRNEDFTCDLVTFRDKPTPVWVCVPSMLAPSR